MYLSSEWSGKYPLFYKAKGLKTGFIISGVVFWGLYMLAIIIGLN